MKGDIFAQNRKNVRTATKLSQSGAKSKWRNLEYLGPILVYSTYCVDADRVIRNHL